MNRAIQETNVLQQPAPPRIDASTSVFINCPYDREYEPLADALFLAIVVCGFYPRSALDSNSVDVPRIERIFNALASSKYSIHDLSRFRGQGDDFLARFNMPLELGMAMFRRFSRSDEHPHSWLVLVPSGAPFARLVSDLAGFDPHTHEEDEASIVRSVVAWLAVHPEALPDVAPSDVLSRLPRFREEKQKLKVQWGNIPWDRLIKTASQVASSQAAP